MANWYPGRRFSWFRLTILVGVCAALVLGSIWGVNRYQDTATAQERGAWLGGYVDVTATPSYPFEQLEPTQEGQRTNKNAVLAFIVADLRDPCEPTWGTHFSLEEADKELDLERRIVRYRELGGSVMISFGGQANSELSLVCEDTEQLSAAYAQVLDRYDVSAIDLDIEGELVQDRDALERQAAAIAKLQSQRDGADDLDVWLTLPVTPIGLDQFGLQAVRTHLQAGVRLAGVNAMTMDFNVDADIPMIDRVKSSLEGLHGQLRSLYAEGGSAPGSATAWSMVAATPMIGQNDVRSEVFTLRDARALNEFANEHGMSRLSYWSANRDRECDANWADPTRVSDSCSGVWQGGQTFADALGLDRNGDLTQRLKDEPEALEPAAEIEDDPETSPYPIWNEAAAYPAATKVVWKRNVYEAKWWTQGEQPDAPVYGGSATPWRLIGPVLDGETPIERPKVPAGTYEEWDPKTIYQREARVMMGEDAYEAKWWSQGESPDASLALPQESPWRMLSDVEVREVLGVPEPGVDEVEADSVGD